ncbi:MAG TPA: hypothetical protein VIW19_15360 [Gaiellaceae bacterium]|jgi:hypothetical protein
MRNPKRKRNLVIALVVLLLGVVAAGVGFGAWSLGGSGNASAKATTASSITLADASAFTTADLYPGATGNLKLRATNPNPFPVRITQVSGNGTITSDKGAACDASTGVTLANQTGLTLDLAAGATATLTVANAVSMSNSSDTTCQGAIFTVPVSLTAVSNAP